MSKYQISFDHRREAQERLEQAVGSTTKKGSRCLTSQMLKQNKNTFNWASHQRKMKQEKPHIGATYSKKWSQESLATVLERRSVENRLYYNTLYILSCLQTLID